jgi:hypothetical protein
VRRNGDEAWRAAERAWLAAPDDPDLGAAFIRAWARAGEPGDRALEGPYVEAWQRAGAPGRDPRKHPLPGDVVEALTDRGWASPRPELRRYEVIPYRRPVVSDMRTPDHDLVSRRLLVGTPGQYAYGGGPITQDTIKLPSWRAWARSGHVVRRMPGPVPERPPCPCGSGKAVKAKGCAHCERATCAACSVPARRGRALDQRGGAPSMCLQCAERLRVASSRCQLCCSDHPDPGPCLRCQARQRP